jgi:hypothetical protein
MFNTAFNTHTISELPAEDIDLLFDVAISRLKAFKQFGGLLDYTYQLLEKDPTCSNSQPEYRQFIQECHRIYQACPHSKNYMVN